MEPHHLLLAFSVVCGISLAYLIGLHPTPTVNNHDYKISSPYSLTETEAHDIFYHHVGKSWRFYWKKESPSWPCTGNPSHKFDFASEMDFPKNMCLGHTIEGVKIVEVHDKTWHYEDIVGNPYNSDLHVLLHEIAHVKAGLDEGHGPVWNRTFRLLCRVYNHYPRDYFYAMSLNQGIETIRRAAFY